MKQPLYLSDRDGECLIQTWSGKDFNTIETLVHGKFIGPSSTTLRGRWTSSLGDQFDRELLAFTLLERCPIKIPQIEVARFLEVSPRTVVRMATRAFAKLSEKESSKITATGSETKNNREGGVGFFNAEDAQAVSDKMSSEGLTIKNSYTIVPGSVAVVCYEGSILTIDSTHCNFKEVIKLLKADDLKGASALGDIKKTLEDVLIGHITISSDRILYKGEEISSKLTETILRLFRDVEGDYRPLAKFMHLLQDNPSFKSKKDLFGFMEHADIRINEDGWVQCWKVITKDYLDCHTETMDNSIGVTVSMPRDEVDDDSRNTCSAGLHVCAAHYAPYFSSSNTRLVKVLVNPADVVSVPVDYKNAKMRVCSYLVLEEIDSLPTLH